jgi:hypothetical protein
MFPHHAPEKNAPLKREVARPPAHDRVFAQLLLLSTLPMLAGMASLWVGVFLGPGAGQPVPTSHLAVLPSEVAQRAVAPTPVAEPLEPGFALVFDRAGATYVHLQDMDAIDMSEDTEEDLAELGDAEEGDDFEEDVRPARAPLPPHASPVLVRVEGMPAAAVAAVKTEDLPASIAAWQGREVLVDGVCRARVTGIDLVARVYSEDLAYDAEQQQLSDTAVARMIFDDAGHLVLAARLDACQGTYAQPADVMAAAIPARLLDSHPAVPAALRALQHSAPGRVAQRMWRENDYEGTWWQDADVTTHVLQHPRTGEVFLSVHAQADVECGGLEISLWGMYRVTSGPAGIEPLTERRLDNVRELQTFLDIDGDGRFEMLAASRWGMDTFLLGADGGREAMLHLPYVGCQC